jgi:hypothetical protein
MTNPIAERLRNFEPKRVYQEVHVATLLEAALEIDRLTAELDGARAAVIEECAKIADGMAHIGYQLIADNNAYEARSGNSAADANKFCELRVSVSEDIAGHIRALASTSVKTNERDPV